MNTIPLLSFAAILLQAEGDLPQPGPGSPLGANLVLNGGRIWTGDPAHPTAQAVAVAGERILAVGSDEEIAPLVTPATRVIDLAGRRVVPGLIDSHVHFLGGGDELLGADLRGARSVEELARRLGEVAAALPPGTWITSGTWDHENWPGAELPTAADLDAATPKHPVLVQRLDGHMAVANALAMKLAGVDAETPDVEGGTIVRDAAGAPSGVFKDAAMALVAAHVPPWTEEQRLARARAALRHAARLGVTGVHDMLDSLEALDTYQTLRRAGELTVRVTVYIPMAEQERWSALGLRRGFGDGLLEVNGVKGFADGSLGSTTALFFEAYADAPDTRGLALVDLGAGGEMEQRVRACVAGDLQVAVHAIGDRAIRSMLDIYGRAAPEGAVNLRLRIEHAQHVHPDDLARFAAMGVIASMQPYHAADDGRWAEKRIGAERCLTTYAFRDLLQRGATLAFGSDWPVAPLSPWLGIEAAVTRRTLDGAHPDGWVPRQKIGVEDALAAYTRGAAFAAFDEERLGSIAPGKLADLLVLDRDPLDIPPEEIGAVEVDLTLLGGRVVHERPARTTRPRDR